MRRLTALVAAAIAGLGAFPAAAAPEAEPAGTQVRVLTWNILHGGREYGPRNLPNLLDQVVAVRPDVFFTVETYGSGPDIERALTERAGKGAYTGVRVTDRPPGEDNLWLFTRFPVSHRYPAPHGGVVDDFNFGGARVRLPDGAELNLFTVWLPYSDPWNGYLVDDNAAAIRTGVPPRHSGADVQRAETEQQRHIDDIVRTQLPAMLGGNTDPVLMGGDFNTLAAHDWRPEHAACSGHLGMSYPLGATAAVTAAGFADTYRTAHPDVCAEPGSTWSPQPAERMITPQRIDFTFARGDVRVERSEVIDQRIPEHGPGVFYSDHAAVLTDLVVAHR
ncbi:endonuclease/exonuclease/phosphatase family protein [Saccharopolyspora erythraea NRRL 2338]|uniref:Exported phosphatase n=2 Tax=Saccharopolyspora erythraea TaxID=1836 RepID=A4F5T0_SACEN|nr:endonuclease/exonuclease/phosphatase family protein [Saccharopolyspora erythraea]EQD83490.1 exotoxin [Saccharopolyspora erythraea D]PFG93204.1 endonuclease/exonuclease/phosphatase family protein [Saccharopolyspora erythraea NRRL 2338]QRK90063.1 endonuclease/exonuclease/phosphatase family protein [Saccharopolyspora erythraea]CAL99404.1 putative exported phosphatase [Saccharopolyspora erythraea NRRL 2338]